MLMLIFNENNEFYQLSCSSNVPSIFSHNDLRHDESIFLKVVNTAQFVVFVTTTTTTYHYVPWQVDAISHGADFFEGIEHGPVRAAHGPPVLVLGVTKFIKTSCTSSLQWKH